MADLELNFDLQGYFTLLNLGCGKQDSPNAGLRSVMEGIPCKIALDINEEYLQTWKNVPGWIPLWKDIRDLGVFLSKSIDMVCCLDVIEHLAHQYGEDLLEDIDRICKKKAIIWTPEGFVNTVEHQMQEWKDMDYNTFQLHRSGWQKEDFEKRGYKVWVLEDYHKFETGSFGAILAIKEY
jgi:hypothetical protein